MQLLCQATPRADDLAQCSSSSSSYNQVTSLKCATRCTKGGRTIVAKQTAVLKTLLVAMPATQDL